MATSDTERARLIRSARSLCWEAFGASTEDMNDLQCLIRAAVYEAQSLSDKAGAFLDLAEELASDYGNTASH